ncbi:MAG TPA: ABC transporter transmembrane domain-containing protein, partial [Thermomicrobiales bacterium]|nr:ABC transporter transmembrane domain-containing protein [Thermomicrobiales bacterium]
MSALHGSATASRIGTWELIRRFAAYYRPHRKLFLIDFGSAVFVAMLELAFPLAVQLFIDDLLPGDDWGLIITAASALLLIYLINAGLMMIVNYWGHMLGINIETELRRRSFDHLQKLSFRFYDNNRTGHIIGRVTKDLEEI